LFALVGSVILLPIGIGAGILFTWSKLEQERDVKQIKYLKQLASACDIVTNAYSVRPSLVRALGSAAEFTASPLREDFQEMVVGLRQGEFEETLRILADRRRSIIFDMVANALTRDSRGYESQFATNHLGHFQLTARLWPLLAKSGHARVVSVSSIGHMRNGLDLADPGFERRPYDKWTAYGQAKSANALFARHLDTLGKPYGVRAFSVHPGGIATPLQRHLSMDEQRAMGWYDAEGNVNERFKSTEQGAATSVWCAVSPLLEGEGGVYCEDCNIAAAVDATCPDFSGARPHIQDAALAKALWAKSEEMTGAAFRP